MQEWLIPGLGWGECKSTQIVKTYEDWECPMKTEWDNCNTPWGTTVTHWDLVLSFNNETATLEEGCQSRTSICNDGEFLDGVEPYDYEKCGYDEESIKALTGLPTREEGEVCDPDLDANHCTVNGFVFANGTSQIFYTAWANVNGKRSCDSQKRSEQKQPNCPSPFGWYRWAPGQTGTAYKSASVPNGSTCEAVSIVCAYWSVRYWTAANPGAIVGWSLAQSCSVNPPSPCSSACIPFGNGQTCESTKVTSTCTNWVLSPWAWSACSCEIAAPSPCVAPNGQTVSHESSLTLYQYPKVQALPWDGSDTCVRQWRQCINWTFHDWNGTPASFTFQYPSCDVIEPPAGWGPGWEWVPTA